MAQPVELCPKCTELLEQDKRQKARERDRRWRQRHPERAKELGAARTRRWTEANPDRSRELRRKWADANRDTLQGYQERRRAHKLAAFVEDVDRKVLYERDEGHCGICYRKVDPKNFHVDHAVPLSKGGEHSYANCQIAHPACNLQKRDKLG